jgi:uracil permease
MAKRNVMGYLPNDTPPSGQIVLLGFQHVLTMFPATVLVAALCGFHIGTVLTISGVGTIVALLPSGGLESSFRYFTVPVLAISLPIWQLPNK